MEKHKKQNGDNRAAILRWIQRKITTEDELQLVRKTETGRQNQR